MPREGQRQRGARRCEEVSLLEFFIMRISCLFHRLVPIHIRIGLASVGAAVALLSPGAHANEPDVSVSVGISQPGFYGQVTIGNAPPPVIYAQPVIIAPARHHHAPLPPIYVRVPRGHEKNWRKHCGYYQACGRPVYFVRYDDNDERRWHDEHGGRGPDHGRGRGHDHGHGRGH